MFRSTTERRLAAALALLIVGWALERERRARAGRPAQKRAFPTPPPPGAPRSAAPVVAVSREQAPAPIAPAESTTVLRPEPPARALAGLSVRRTALAATVVALTAGGAVAAVLLSRPGPGAAMAPPAAVSTASDERTGAPPAAPPLERPQHVQTSVVVPPPIGTPTLDAMLTVATAPVPAARPSAAAVQSLSSPALEPAAVFADLIETLPPPAPAEASLVNAQVALPAPEAQAPIERPGAGAPSLDGLKQTLAPLFEGFAGRAGIAVVDLQTGERLTIGGDQQFQAASTIKFFVVLSVLNDIAQGRYTFADVETDINGVMIQQNNYNARNLTRRTGIPTVNDRLRLWGLSRTIITHPSGFPEEHFPLYSTNDNLTSPSDAARGLLLLYRGRIAQPAASRTLIDHLTQASRWYGIEGAVPDGEGRVFYKVGWLPEGDFSAVHDLGIVEFERHGRTVAYALAIYTQGAVPQWPAWALIRDAALQVWDFFAYRRYPAEAIAANVIAAAGS